MSKFKVNDKVQVIATNEVGVIKGHETTPIEGTKKVKIEYIVKVGNGFDKWKVYQRHELKKVINHKDELRVYTKIYDIIDGYKLTMYAKVNNTFFLNDNFETRKGRKLNIGYSIYNPSDVYDEKIGISLAKRRSRTSPFCHMESKFSGEFNKETIEAIMDVKSVYIKNNIDKFINKKNKTN